MRDFVILSERGMGLPIAMRLEDLGSKCAMYVHEEDCKQIGSGLLKGGIVEDISEVCTLPRETIVLIEGTAVKTGSAEDRRVLKDLGFTNDEQAHIRSIFGAASMVIREWGFDVIGASRKGFDVCGTAAQQFALAKSMGIQTGDYESLKTMKQLRGYVGSVPLSLFPSIDFESARIDERYAGESLGVLCSTVDTKCDVVARACRAPMFRYELVGWFNGHEITTTLIRLMSFGDPYTPGEPSRSLFISPKKKTDWSRMEALLRKSEYMGPIRLRFVRMNVDVFDGIRLSLDADCELAIETLLRRPYHEWLANGFISGFNDDACVSTIHVRSGLFAGTLTASKPGIGRVNWVAARSSKDGGIQSLVCNTPVAIVVGKDTDARAAEIVCERTVNGVHAPLVNYLKERLCGEEKSIASTYQA